MRNYNLPEQVPYLGAKETNFLGNGIVGAGGGTYGVWDYLVSPYSCESFIDREAMSIVIDGIPHILGANMRRLRGTGMFSSVKELLGVRVTLVDFAVWDQPYAVRAVLVQNLSDQTRDVCVRGAVTPATYRKYGWQVNNGAGYSAGIHLTLSQNTRHIHVGFNTPSSITGDWMEILTIETNTVALPAGSSLETGLYHGKDDIKTRDVLTDINKTVGAWREWFDKGHSLDVIPRQRDRDIIEGSLAIIKMQQGADGGIMATPRSYPQSFIRDTHSALRGMMAAGHFDEAKKYLYFIKEKYRQLKNEGVFPITNNAAIGMDSYHIGFGEEEHHIAETPALFVLVAKMYYEKTSDIDTVMDIAEVIDFAVKVQIDYAEKNGYRLKFNGDETDSGGCGIPLFDRPAPPGCGSDKWSMPSLVMCIKSVEFYNQLQGKNEYDRVLQKLKDSLDANFWRQDYGIYDWYRAPDGGWPKVRLPDFHFMPLYFLGCSEKNDKSALAMKQYFKNGVIPVQPDGINDDFCGHALGYLLYAMCELDDEMKHAAYDALMKLAGCWGTWSESYHADGTPYFEETWDGRQHNMRPFESGVNIDAIMRYWNINTWK